MKVKERKDWKNLNTTFNKWYLAESHPSWVRQKNWLSKELIKRWFVEKAQLSKMWNIFQQLTDNVSEWKVQSKILSFIILCLNK
jgi:hypothetical protein